MVCIYCLNTDTVVDEEGDEFRVYGIDAYGQEQGELRVMRSVKGIFCDRHDAEDLVERCNTLELHLVHLQDVIEDALA